MPLGVLIDAAYKTSDTTFEWQVKLVGYWTGGSIPGRSYIPRDIIGYNAVISAWKRSIMEPNNSGKIDQKFLQQAMDCCSAPSPF